MLEPYGLCPDDEEGFVLRTAIAITNWVSGTPIPHQEDDLLQVTGDDEKGDSAQDETDAMEVIHASHYGGKNIQKQCKRRVLFQSPLLPQPRSKLRVHF